MSNIYGVFTGPGAKGREDARRQLEEQRERRESAGRANLSRPARLALDDLTARLNRRPLCTNCMRRVHEDGQECIEFSPEVVSLTDVWNLPADHQYALAGRYRDVPKEWPRCVYRAEFSGYMEDHFMTVDGRWLHPDAWGFSRFLLPIGYELVFDVGTDTRSGIITQLSPGQSLEAAACRDAGIPGWIGSGTDPRTGLTSISGGHPGKLAQTGWSMRITSAEGKPWTAKLG